MRHLITLTAWDNNGRDYIQEIKWKATGGVLDYLNEAGDISLMN